jgi:probable F420-dependent oxidoreductase
MNKSFGIKLPGLVPTVTPSFRTLPDYVAALENIGFDDVMDGEHILFVPFMDHPGGAGNMVHERVTQRSDRADTLIMFTAIAMRTSRIKMVSSIILAAAHSFAVLARQASTLDLVSSGRFMLGVGGGWNLAEFEAQGIPPKERDARTEETVRACRALWTPGLSEYHGRWIDFANVVSEPAPVTPGGPPIWWGGNALRGRTSARVAEFCAGWLSREAAGYEEIAPSIDAIRHQCDVYGRDPGSVGFRASALPTGDWSESMSRQEIVDRVLKNCEQLAAAGVTHFNVPQNYFRLELEELGQLLAQLRAAVA